MPEPTISLPDARALCGHIDLLEQALRRIAAWAAAYPLEIFPEPDLIAARLALDKAGVSFDALNASTMRRVLSQIEKIAVDALPPPASNIPPAPPPAPG